MIVALLALAAVQAQGGDASARPAGPARPVVNVEWTAMPSSDDYINAYPEQAWSAGRSGRATLSCQANAAGALSQCEVTSEKPKRLGFGAAALRLAPKFRLAPESWNQSITGGHISFDIQFKMPATR